MRGFTIAPNNHSSLTGCRRDLRKKEDTDSPTCQRPEERGWTLLLPTQTAATKKTEKAGIHAQAKPPTAPLARRPVGRGFTLDLSHQTTSLTALLPILIVVCSATATNHRQLHLPEDQRARIYLSDQGPTNQDSRIQITVTCVTGAST